MQDIKKGYSANKVILPSNIKEFLDRDGRQEQKLAANKANKWLHSICGRSFSGGTAVGKHYDTLILDISYQGSDVYISVDGEIRLNGKTVTTKKEFAEQFKLRYNVTE